MLWVGLIIGMVIGGCIGLVVAAMCVAADIKYDPPEIFKLQCVKFEENETNNQIP
jgi:hypothetical protein